MAHPEPLEKGIEALRLLDEQSYIYMLNRKNPIPLINLAKQHGYHTLSCEDDTQLWHILIGKSEDKLKELLDV